MYHLNGTHGRPAPAAGVLVPNPFAAWHTSDWPVQELRNGFLAFLTRHDGVIPKIAAPVVVTHPPASPAPLLAVSQAVAVAGPAASVDPSSQHARSYGAVGVLTQAALSCTSQHAATGTSAVSAMGIAAAGKGAARGSVHGAGVCGCMCDMRR